MTERFKYELYAQLETRLELEHDLTALVKGATLRTINPDTLRSHTRFFKLDLFHYKLLANTKKCWGRKACKFHLYYENVTDKSHEIIV